MHLGKLLHLAKLESNRDGRQLLRIAKLKAKERCDVSVVSCLKSRRGVVKLKVGGHTNFWNNCMKKLMKMVENGWGDSVEQAQVECQVSNINGKR